MFLLISTAAIALYLASGKKANPVVNAPLDEKRKYLIDKYVNPETAGSEILAATLPKMKDEEVDFFIKNEQVIFQQKDKIDWSNPIIQKAFGIFKMHLPDLQPNF